MKKTILKTQEAVAKDSGAMKTGGNSKSLTGKGNFFKYVGIFAFAVALTVVACSAGGGQSGRWEYKIESIRISFDYGATSLEEHTDAFNSLGAEGWELVSVTTGNIGNGYTSNHLFTFKRRLP